MLSVMSLIVGEMVRVKYKAARILAHLMAYSGYLGSGDTEYDVLKQCRLYIDYVKGDQYVCILNKI
jgi:hypothetical protein